MGVPAHIYIYMCVCVCPSHCFLDQGAKVHHKRVKYCVVHNKSMRSEAATKPANDWTPAHVAQIEHIRTPRRERGEIRKENEKRMGWAQNLNHKRDLIDIEKLCFVGTYN